MNKIILFFTVFFTFTNASGAKAEEFVAEGSADCGPISWAIDLCGEQNRELAAHRADQEADRLCGEHSSTKLSTYTYSEYTYNFGVYAKAQATYECSDDLPKEVITCSTNILTSVCGTGKIQINLLQNDALEVSKFELINGDVGCWFAEFSTNGALKRIESPHQLISYKKYEMSIPHINESTVIGNVIFGKRNRNAEELAYLELIPNEITTEFGALHGRYNLACSRN